MNRKKELTKVLVYGAGGFGREIVCVLKSDFRNKYDFIGFIDDGLPAGTENLYGKVLGDFSFLNTVNEPVSVFISIATPELREKIPQRITNPLVSWPNLIAPDTKLFDPNSLSIGQGNILFSSCRVSCEVSIGNFNLMNSLVSFGHDVRIGDCNVFMPNSRISGESVIGNGNFFGVGSILLQGLKVGNNTRIAASSVVMRNTKDHKLYLGNPAKIVEHS